MFNKLILSNQFENKKKLSLLDKPLEENMFKKLPLSQKEKLLDDLSRFKNNTL